jgi:hypothetical protein
VKTESAQERELSSNGVGQDVLCGEERIGVIAAGLLALAGASDAQLLRAPSGNISIPRVDRTHANSYAA